MRTDSWPEDLDDAIEAMRSTPFVWGKSDCCMFAADIVKIITGVDYAKEFRGRYKTMKGARRVLGSKSLSQILDTKFQVTKSPIRGDVVLIPVEITQQPIPALGICLGVHTAYMCDSGLAFIRTSETVKAWSIDNGR